MTPIVLAVHFPAKQLSKLRMAAMRLGAKVRGVEKWEYLNAVGALTSMIEPLMIVFLAVVVGGIVMALFMPLISIIEKLGG